MMSTAASNGRKITILPSVNAVLDRIPHDELLLPIVKLFADLTLVTALERDYWAKKFTAFYELFGDRFLKPFGKNCVYKFKDWVARLFRTICDKGTANWQSLSETEKVAYNMVNPPPETTTKRRDITRTSILLVLDDDSDEEVVQGANKGGQDGMEEAPDPKNGDEIHEDNSPIINSHGQGTFDFDAAIRQLAFHQQHQHSNETSQKTKVFDLVVLDRPHGCEPQMVVPHHDNGKTDVVAEDEEENEDSNQKLAAIGLQLHGDDTVKNQKPVKPAPIDVRDQRVAQEHDSKPPPVHVTTVTTKAAPSGNLYQRRADRLKPALQKVRERKAHIAKLVGNNGKTGSENQPPVVNHSNLAGSSKSKRQLVLESSCPSKASPHILSTPLDELVYSAQLAGVQVKRDGDHEEAKATALTRPGRQQRLTMVPK